MLTLELSDIVDPILGSVKIQNACTYSPRELRKYYPDIDFDVKLSCGSNLQRGYVWTLSQKQEFILSLLKGINMPEFLFIKYTFNKPNDFRDSIFKVVDGKQRLSTLFEFMDSKFAINVESKSLDESFWYEHLSKELQMSIWNCRMNVRTIYEYEGEELSDKQLVALFEMVNFSGTPQDISHLKNLKSLLK